MYCSVRFPTLTPSGRSTPGTRCKVSTPHGCPAPSARTPPACVASGSGTRHRICWRRPTASRIGRGICSGTLPPSSLRTDTPYIPPGRRKTARPRTLPVPMTISGWSIWPMPSRRRPVILGFWTRKSPSSRRIWSRLPAAPAFGSIFCGVWNLLKTIWANTACPSFCSATGTTIWVLLDARARAKASWSRSSTSMPCGSSARWPNCGETRPPSSVLRN